MSIVTNIVDASPSFIDVDGTVKYIVPQEALESIERDIAEMELLHEIEKGDWSLENEQTLSRADFQRKYGLEK